MVRKICFRIIWDLIIVSFAAFIREKRCQDVPLNSLLLSSPVPRNAIACSLDPQKYSLMFPKISYLMVSHFDTLPFIV